MINANFVFLEILEDMVKSSSDNLTKAFDIIAVNKLLVKARDLLDDKKPIDKYGMKKYADIYNELYKILCREAIIKSRKVENEYWVYYFPEGAEKTDTNLTKDNCGKWMYFFKSKDFIASICKEAIERGIVEQCKHSNAGDGVSCFYINDFDKEAHRRVISFFIEKELIEKTKTGRYYNIGFKLDNQTRAGQYGEDFKPTIKLENIINLNTGEFL